MAKTAEQYKRELRDLAENLPFGTIEVPDFRKSSFEPEQIRQEREYIRSEERVQTISRFLLERGVVDILPNEKIIKVFTEIHWCAYHIRKSARKRLKGTAAWRAEVVQARGMISRIEAAEEELFIANRRLVVSCVKPFYWIGQVWISDFLQEGSKALTNAIRKFDFTRGVPFYAYAQRAIQNRLRNYFRDHARSGSLGVHPTRDMTLVKQAIEEWKEDHTGEEPDNSVISAMTGLPEAMVKKVRQFIKQWANAPVPPVSLDAMLGETDVNLYEFVEDEKGDGAVKSAEKAEIWDAVDRLPPRSRYIMRLRFIEGLTLEETGLRVNLTRARIKQIQDEALQKLRSILHTR